MDTEAVAKLQNVARKAKPEKNCRLNLSEARSLSSLPSKDKCKFDKPPSR